MVCYLILPVNDYLFLYRIYFLIKPLREIFCLVMCGAPVKSVSGLGRPDMSR